MKQNNQAIASGVPEFKMSALEAKALVLIDSLSGRKPGVVLSPQHQREVESLFLAYRQGNKPKAFALSNGYFAEIMTPEKLNQAYALVANLHLSGNSDFQIVMDSLHEKIGDTLPSQPYPIAQEDAVIYLLLAITHSDKNSISFKRLDTESGQLRPTTFPLTEQMIRNFLAPFENHESLFKRYVLMRNHTIMSNPAAYIYVLYQRRKQAYQIELKAYKEQQAQSALKPTKTTQEPHKRRAAPANWVEEVQLVGNELEKMLSETPNTQEKAALVSSLQPDQVLTLMPYASQESTDFGQKLAKMYRQHLSPGQASFLAAKMASRMKRVLTEMDSWKEDYWSDFQTLMQQQGIWEGNEWLNKWRAQRKGKEHLIKAAETEPEQDLIGDMIKQSQKIQDKQKGKKMLAKAEYRGWVTEKTQTGPEERKILNALAKVDNLEELFALAFADSLWEEESPELRTLIYEAFCMLSETSLDTIRQQLFNFVSETDKNNALRIYAQLELLINQVMALFKQDRKLSFLDALDILEERQMQGLMREKMNAPEYKNSAAAKYSAYNPGA